MEKEEFSQEEIGRDGVKYFKTIHYDLLEDIERITQVTRDILYIELYNGEEIIHSIYDDTFENISNHNTMTEQNRKYRFAAILKIVMNEKNISQNRLRQLINFNRIYSEMKPPKRRKDLTRWDVSRYTRGTLPSNEYLLREIAYALDCSFEYMWGLE